MCVVFTVTADGRVRDAKATESGPEGYHFEDAALRAVGYWRYEPASADTPGVQVLIQFKRASPPPPLTVYLGAFTVNAADLEPIVIKHCDSVAETDAESVLNSTVAEFETGFGMSCEKQAGNLSYACLDRERRTIARIRIWKSLPDCWDYPKKFANDAKALMNRH